MNNFSYNNIKKAYQKYLLEQEIKAFLKSQYGIEERSKTRPKEIKKSEIKNNKTTNSKFKQELSLEEKISELNEFLQDHFKRVGKEQALKDFQRGLNILNGYSKNNPIKEKNKIKEDGDFGRITEACLIRLLKIYSINSIKKAIRTASLNNAYAKSCFDRRINIENEINRISNDMIIKEIV